MLTTNSFRSTFDVKEGEKDVRGRKGEKQDGKKKMNKEKRKGKN